MHALVLKEITGISHKSQVGLYLSQKNDKLVFRIKFGFGGGGYKGREPCLVLSSNLGRDFARLDI